MTCPYCGGIDLEDVSIGYKCLGCGEISYGDEANDDDDYEEDEEYSLC